MDKIKLGDIDFSKLDKFKIQGTSSTMYKNDDKCIKILDKFTDEERFDLYMKLLDMDGIKIDNVLMPIDLIIDDGNLIGYTTEYFKYSINLYDKFINDRYVNVKDIFKAVKKASNILRNIHDNEIVYQDLSFDNILIDKDGNVKFIDIDACNYKNHMSNIISMILKRFMIDYRKENIILTENVDKISMYISTFCTLYIKEIQNISNKKYNSLASHVKTLDNMYKVSRILVDKKNRISELPYLDELIDDSDDYIIDRDKQITVVDKILVYFQK